MTDTTRPEGQELPPLPELTSGFFQTSEGMRLFDQAYLEGYARAAIAAHEACKVQAEPVSPSPAAVPDGWMLVPMRLAPPMRAEARLVQEQGLDGDGFTLDDLWSAMLSGVPAVPAAAEDDKRDAERYRWLRDSDSIAWPSVDLSNACHRASNLDKPELVDAAIDAAMQATKETSHE